MGQGAVLVRVGSSVRFTPAAPLPLLSPRPLRGRRRRPAVEPCRSRCVQTWCGWPATSAAASETRRMRMTSQLLRRLLYALVLVGFAGGLAACDDTFRGAGQDMEDIGDEAKDATD